MTPRMRTIAEAAAELRQLDPGTAVTPHYIRRLVLSHTIPHHRVGNKRLINLDLLLAYLNEPAPAQTPAPPPGDIRPVAE